MEELLKEKLTGKLQKIYRYIENEIEDVIRRLNEFRTNFEELKKSLEIAFGEEIKEIDLERALEFLNEACSKFPEFLNRFKELPDKHLSEAKKFLEKTEEAIKKEGLMFIYIPNFEYIYKEICKLCEQKGIDIEKLGKVNKLRKDYETLLGKNDDLNSMLRYFYEELLKSLL